MKKKTQLILWIIFAIIALGICGYICTNIAYAKTYEAKDPVATFEIQDYGTFKIELYPKYAPNTVANFVNLINKGFYDGKTFYGKDVNAIYATKTSDGEDVKPTMKLIDSGIEEGSDDDYNYQIDGEFVANDFNKNILKHEKGVVSMLREEYSSYFGLKEESFNSGSAHFQILLDSSRNLNGMYCAFGKVIEGLDIVEAIFNSELEPKETEEEETTSTENKIENFLSPAVITKATVETYGIDYGVPEVHEAFDYSQFLQSYFTQQ